MDAAKSVGIVMCALLLAGAGSSQPGPRGVSDREVAASVPEEFKALWEGGLSMDKVAETWKAFPYDRIDLERSACFGTCPEYRVSLFRGGRAELHGVRYTDRLGDYGGKVYVGDYGKRDSVDALCVRRIPSRGVTGGPDPSVA
jgi:hypothetical protein